MKIRIYIIVILVNLLSIKIYSQNFKIAGKITDLKTSEALAFVNIGIQGVIGTISDFEGNFSLEIPDKFINDSLSVSYVGYEPLSISILKNKNKTNLEIKLVPKEYNIPEVEIVAKSLYPYTIIKNATLNIYKNFYQSAFNYNFSLSSTTNENGKIVKSRNLTGIIYDNEGYQRNSKTAYYNSVKYKFLTSEQNYEIISIFDGYINIDDILKADIVRISGNILDIAFVTDFDLNLEQSFLNGDSVYIISYKCLNPTIYNTGDANIISYSGTLTLNTKDLSIIKNTATALSSDFSDLGKSFYNSKTNQFTFSDVKYTFTTEYSKEDNISILKSIDYTINYTKTDTTDGTKTQTKISNNLKINKFTNSDLTKIETRQYFVK